jgi:hypothetical protein
MILLTPLASEVFYSDSTRLITGSEDKPHSEKRNYFNARPNPFNPSVQLIIPKQVKNITAVQVFDIKGRQIADLSKDVINSQILWCPEKCIPSGIFIVRFSAGKTIIKHLKITMVR